MLLKSAIVLVLSVPGFAADSGAPTGSLTVHEWGTFTSVAGLSGNPVYWTPLSGPSDLPCFVHRRGLESVKSMGTLVRMETPVLYFYAPSRMTLSVHVGFPLGLISEWYPQASKIVPETANVSTHHSEVAWNNVEVHPGESLEFPTGKSASHYYAARNTDAAPLRIGDQQEKLIFYRGVGTFSIPVQPVSTREGRIDIRNTASAPLSVILFENRNGKQGYRMIRQFTGTVNLDEPELNGDVNLLPRTLVNELVELGLYRKEAEAMVETWRDSWFEEGMRVFYFVPRAKVDYLLPLTVEPPPAHVARVFVGRVEMLSPSIRQSIEAALASGDVPVLQKYGRFLDPFLTEIRKAHELPQAPAVMRFLNSRYQAAANESRQASCVQ